MSSLQQKIRRHAIRQGKTVCRKTRISEPDSDMTQILEWSDKNFKIPVIIILGVLVKKVESMQKQIRSMSKEREILKKNEMLEVKKL